MSTPFIGDLIRDTADRGMAELLIAVADYFYCIGAGIIPPPPRGAGRAELLATLAHMHRIEVLGPRGWRDPPILNDDLPGWLLAQQQQADPIRAQAAIERQVALGDATPPDGWIRQTAQEGRP
jgi:hypothetical protein